ncbi:MAG TPA: Endolytic murein transglycosylase [Hyphomicrobiaceae bacterium MAG_BT-2024]
MQQRRIKPHKNIRPISPIEAVEPAKAPKRAVEKKRKKLKKSVKPVIRFFNSIFTVLFFITTTLAVAHFWFERTITSAGPLREDKLLNISKGKTEHQIAEALEREGIISSRYLVLAHQFRDRVWNVVDKHNTMAFKAGIYRFKAFSSSKEIVYTLRGGASELISISFPEGLTSFEIVSRLRNNRKLTGDIINIPAEGTLKPDTYRVHFQGSRNRILKQMALQQTKFLDAAWQRRQPNLPYDNVTEALILASIVEKEMGPRDNPGNIASVFINRLRLGMRLQSDPTILYGKFGPSVAWGSLIYKSDIRKKTTHNTYQIGGLPPTPICNPGSVAVEAALNPKKTNFLYFVADGKGGHIFSNTLAEHNRAVMKWRSIERRIRAVQKIEREVLANSTGIESAPISTDFNRGRMRSSSLKSVDLLTPNGTLLPQRHPTR